MSQTDAAYYRRRAREEREHAKQVTMANAVAIHKKLGEPYEALADREELTASVASTQQRQPNRRPSV